MQKTIQIENWSFAPETGMLQDGSKTSRLEHRTAVLLELLSRYPRRVVTHEDIIAEVWSGRSVSPNSVAVAISDIRRALNDDPKAPTFIETVPKRGYRLIAQVTAELEAGDTAKPTSRRMIALLALAALVAVAVIAVISIARPTHTPIQTTVAVVPATNQTGDTRYDPLTLSVTELLAVELARQNSFTVATQSNAAVVVSGKLILWDGHPSMSIHAISVPSGEVIWSGMASGPETLLPRQVREEIAEFAEIAVDGLPIDDALQ